MMSRRVVTGLGMICIVVVAIMIAWLVQTDPGSQPPPEPTGSASPTTAQQGMLVAVRSDSGAIADAIVIAAGGTSEAPTASLESLQPGLGLGFTTTGVTTLAQTGSSSPQSIQSQLAGQLGVRIPNGLVMDRLAFAGMVDAVGGVVVYIAKPIYGPKIAGKRTVLFPAGNIHLYGLPAAEYVLLLASNEDQAARMGRFEQVWTQIVAGLPSDELRVRSMLGSLGSSAQNSTTVAVMATLLVNYQQAQSRQSLLVGTLPVRATGKGATAIYTPDPVATVALSTKLFGDIPLTPGANGNHQRVRLVDAGATGTELVQAQDQLYRAGIDVIFGGIAVPQRSSKIFVSEPASATTIDTQLSAALGLPLVPVQANATKAAGVTAELDAAADLFTTAASASPSSVSASPSSGLN